MVNTAIVTTAAHGMDRHNEYLPEKPVDIVFYAGKDLLNKRHTWTDLNDLPWDFSDAVGFTWKIWEEREGGLLMISWISPTNLTWSGNEVILNAPATDTDIERGKYYYEIEYLVAGGYSVLIAFGEAKFI